MAQLTRRLLQTGQRFAAIAGMTLLTSGLGGLSAAATPFSTADNLLEASDRTELSFDPRFCPDDLAPALDRIVGRSTFATAHWGVAVYPLKDERLLYAHNAERYLIPASNIKLMTTAAAMQAIAAHGPENLWDFRDALNLVNRDSNNARADAMLRNVGGQSRVRTILEPLGVDPSSYVQADGSGLSRRNQAEPAAFIALLKGMHESDDSGLFYESLPVGGYTGTLRNRFAGTRVQGKVHAKTGTLRGVRALSGYLETEDYGTVIFSIMVNQSGQSGRVMLDAIDEMVLTMSQLESCDG